MAETTRAVLVTAALNNALERVDRRAALGEAQVAVLEAAVRLIQAEHAELADRPGEGTELLRTELLRDALGSVRAAVVATGVALTESHMTSRRLPQPRLQLRVADPAAGRAADLPLVLPDPAPAGA